MPEVKETMDTQRSLEKKITSNRLRGIRRQMIRRCLPDWGGGNESNQLPPYRDSFQGRSDTSHMEIDCSKEDSDVSDTVLFEDEGESPWFSMGMTKKEKVNTRKP